jgi:hypothetical protein
VTLSGEGEAFVAAPGRDTPTNAQEL